MNPPIEIVPGLNNSEVAAASAPLENAWTLPPAAYACPEVGEVEKERVLRKSWLPIGRIEQVPEPGDYLCLDILDQPLMIVHGSDGKMRVMSRVCLHRGAPLAEGSGNKKLFVCPYHAWSYQNDGQLKKAPLMDGADDFEEKNCRLPEIRTEIWNGFILINFDDGAHDFASQVSKFDDYFANYKLEDMRIIRTLEFDSHWNWKVLVENFMEAYHHIAIHSRSIEPQFRARDSKIVDAGQPWSILHMPSAKGQIPEGFPVIESLEDWQQTGLFATVLFPFFLLAMQGNSLVWYQVIPSAHDRLMLKIHICVPETSLEIAGFDEVAAMAEQLVSAVHHEDIEANDMVWKGLSAPLTTQGRLSPLEQSIWQLNQWWLGKMQTVDV